MKILSISDVITNSSSEIFAYFNKESEQKLKEFVNTILKTFHVNKTFDDLFTIEYELLYDAEETGITSIEEALDREMDSDGRPYISGYKVIPRKHGQYERLCQLLSELPDMFDHDIVYNT